jgi:hypothetical protein
VAGDTVRSLGATIRWPDATVRPGRRGSGTGQQHYRLPRLGGTICVGAGSGGRTVVMRHLLINLIEFKFDRLNTNSII